MAEAAPLDGMGLALTCVFPWVAARRAVPLLFTFLLNHRRERLYISFRLIRHFSNSGPNTEIGIYIPSYSTLL